MCQSSVYIEKEGGEELFFEDVDYLERGNGEVKMINLFGEERTVKGRVKKFSLLEHKIVVESERE